MLTLSMPVFMTRGGWVRVDKRTSKRDTGIACFHKRTERNGYSVGNKGKKEEKRNKERNGVYVGMLINLDCCRS